MIYSVLTVYEEGQFAGSSEAVKGAQQNCQHDRVLLKCANPESQSQV